MTRRSRIALAFLLIALVGVAVWFTGRRTIQGRSESAWIRSLTNAFSSTTFRPNSDWTRLGSNAVPILLKALESSEGPVQRRYRTLRPKLPMAVQRWTPEPLDYAVVHGKALILLSPVGGVVPRGTQLPLPPIIGALKDPHQGVRMNALSLLGEQMPRSKTEMEAILPAIVTTTKDMNPQVRMNAMWLLQYFSQETNTVLPILNVGLSDSDADVRICAAMSLNGLDLSEQTQARLIPVALGCSQSKAPHGAAIFADGLLGQLATNSPWLSIRRGATNAMEESELMRAAYR